MKIFTLSALVVLSLAFEAAAQAPVGPNSVKLGKLQPSVVRTPEFQIVGGQNKRFKNREWLELEVEFDTVPEEIDELTFKYTVQIEKKLVDGEVTHVSIPKDREHYSVMYISPRSLERLTGGKPLSPASIENAWVEVSYHGQVLGRTSFKPTPIPNAQHLTGMLLNKSETPFAPLYYDRYEAIKAAR